jgi:hypothetical protein
MPLYQTVFDTDWHGVQARLQVSTAAFARQGPSWLDQVRMHVIKRSLNWTSCASDPAQITSRLILAIKWSARDTGWCISWIVTAVELSSDADGVACRRDLGSQLQPVPGRDLLDWSRSGCKRDGGSWFWCWYISSTLAETFHDPMTPAYLDTHICRSFWKISAPFTVKNFRLENKFSGFPGFNLF